MSNSREVVFDIEDEVFSTDQFRMYEFKVKRCPRAKPHDWTQCPFAHPSEKARRRNPRVFQYSGSACPDFRKSGTCPRGDACPLAHGVFESWLHPSRYKTQLCTDGRACGRRVCFFAHSEDELRQPELDYTSQLNNADTTQALQQQQLARTLAALLGQGVPDSSTQTGLRGFDHAAGQHEQLIMRRASSGLRLVSSIQNRTPPLGAQLHLQLEQQLQALQQLQQQQRQQEQQALRHAQSAQRESGWVDPSAALQIFQLLQGNIPRNEPPRMVRALGEPQGLSGGLGGGGGLQRTVSDMTGGQSGLANARAAAGFQTMNLEKRNGGIGQVSQQLQDAALSRYSKTDSGTNSDRRVTVDEMCLPPPYEALQNGSQGSGSLMPIGSVAPAADCYPVEEADILALLNKMSVENSNAPLELPENYQLTSWKTVDNGVLARMSDIALSSPEVVSELQHFQSQTAMDTASQPLALSVGGPTMLEQEQLPLISTEVTRIAEVDGKENVQSTVQHNVLENILQLLSRKQATVGSAQNFSTMARTASVEDLLAELPRSASQVALEHLAVNGASAVASAETETKS